MLSALVEGKDADIWFLVALILFVVAAIISVTDKAWTMALTCAGLAFISLGWLVL